MRMFFYALIVLSMFTSQFASVETKFVNHAGHTRKASRISKTVVENCGKGVGNF